MCSVCVVNVCVITLFPVAGKWKSEPESCRCHHSPQEQNLSESGLKCHLPLSNHSFFWQPALSPLRPLVLHHIFLHSLSFSPCIQVMASCPHTLPPSQMTCSQPLNTPLHWACLTKVGGGILQQNVNRLSDYKDSLSQSLAPVVPQDHTLFHPWPPQ